VEQQRPNPFGRTASVRRKANGLTPEQLAEHFAAWEKELEDKDGV
jgi:hypothetical protein